VLGTVSADGITMGAWDTQLDAWGVKIASEPAMDVVMQHEADHLPSGFTEFAGTAAEFKLMSIYVWNRWLAQGVLPGIHKFGLCLIAKTCRDGNAGDGCRYVLRRQQHRLLCVGDQRQYHHTDRGR
jgi:hypothetical protein